MIGETVSHYRVLEKLGAGGMGVVYKALDLQLERLVALKFLPHEILPSDSDRERFLREARSASALDHPNIGVIYGIDKTPDGQIFIVMAYYEGQTLSEKLNVGQLPLREAIDLAVQISAGLAAAHTRNIIHRDIKPSNIIITKEGTARIVDFGLARIVATPSATLTQTTSGTLPYMAPEQILGEAVDQHCDVWAASVLLVQLVTGSHPFMRENVTSMSFAILNQPPSAIDALPAALQPVALRGLAKNPANRYATAKDLYTDLESFRAQLTATGIPAEPPTSLNEKTSAAFKDALSRASEPRWASASATAAPSKGVAAPYIFAALAVAVLAALALLVPPVRQRAAALLSGKAAERHVAVLPFDNIGNDPANESVAEGLMDSLTSKLTNLDSAQQSLWVVPASVVRSRKISDPSAAGRDLGANLVVKGSIRRDGKDIQLTVNLIDTKDLRQLGSAALEDRTGDLSSLQDEAVARLGRLMNINVSADMLRATGGRASPAAYELYLKALGLMQRYDKSGNLDQAVTALNDAVHTDPQFALGYASLGEAYRLKYKVDSNSRWIEQASSNLERAIQLDNQLPSAFVTLGRLHESSGKYDLAVQEFRHALQLDPRSAEALGGMSRAYESAGRLAEAEDALKRAVALRPDYWDGYNNLGLFYDRQNRYAESIAQLKRAVELTPDNPQAYLNLGAIYSDTGDPKDLRAAEAALKKSVELGPSYAAYANLGWVSSLEGHYADAAAMTEKALQLNDQNYMVWRNLAEFYAWSNQPAKSAEAQRREMDLLVKNAELHPQDAELLSELATLYSGQHLREKAMTAIQKALALAPGNATVLMNAAATSERLGNRSEAIRYVQAGLSKGFSMDDLKRRYSLQAVLNDPNFRAPGKK